MQSYPRYLPILSGQLGGKKASLVIASWELTGLGSVVLLGKVSSFKLVLANTSYMWCVCQRVFIF